VGIVEGRGHPADRALGEDELQALVPLENAGEEEGREKPAIGLEREREVGAERARAGRGDAAHVERERNAALGGSLPGRLRRRSVELH
ncbi:hypothetical protein B8A06_14325, partial [Staphylococcus aureus]